MRAKTASPQWLPAHPILLRMFNKGVRMLTMRDILAVALFGSFCMFSEFAKAAELTPMQATTIYMLAHSTSGYKLPEIAPEVHLVPLKALRDMVCPGKTCAVHALQVRERIFLDEALDMQDLNNASVLYHEYVHFLQWANKGEAKDCTEWLQREYEAYGLQNHVLEKAGMRLLKMPALGCT
jgi:hypothetical protein